MYRFIIRSLPAAALLIAALAIPQRAMAQSHEHRHSHAASPHFVHPLVAESVSPDTKMRLDYQFSGDMELEGEYAFGRSFSIEAGVHYELHNARLGDTHLLFRFANHAFADRGVLVGYGAALGLPTGGGHGHGTSEPADAHEHEAAHEHGSERKVYEVEPFVNAGIMLGDLELAGWARLGLSTPALSGGDMGLSPRYNLSTLYHVTHHLQALVEFDGEIGVTGAEADRRTLNLIPGLKVKPLPDADLAIGFGMSVPLLRTGGNDSRTLISTFYHF